MIKKISVSLCLVALAACHPGGNIPDNADTYTQGQCTYKDAEKKPDGQDQPPAKPEPQPEEDPVQIEVHVSGTGNLGDLATPQCRLEGLSGQFKGVMSGEGEVDDNGGYFAGFVQSEGIFTTPSASCTIPQVNIGALTEVVVVGKLKNTRQNCQTYCSAKARAWAEQQCEGAGSSSSAQASCRASAEGEYEGSCQTTCSGSTTRRIVAELHINATSHADALVDLNARQLGLNGLGTINADLKFQYIKENDGDGEAQPEAPAGQPEVPAEQQ